MTNIKNKKTRKFLILLSVIVLLLATMIVGGILVYQNIERNTYRKEYTAYVEKYAEMYGVDDLLVYSVILTESSFRPDAESDQGARGLMQLMEDAYEWVNFRMKDKTSTSYDDMYDPETNIKYGTYLLSLLQSEFERTEEIAAAYHAGRGGVNSWLKDKQYSSDGKTLDTIPIPQTAHYVEKIVKAYDKYKTYFDVKEN